MLWALIDEIPPEMRETHDIFVARERRDGRGTRGLQPIAFVIHESVTTNKRAADNVSSEAERCRFVPLRAMTTPLQLEWRRAAAVSVGSSGVVSASLRLATCPSPVSVRCGMPRVASAIRASGIFGRRSAYNKPFAS